MMKKKLTVVITTYNRKNELITQLKSLEIQGQYEKYDIVVYNNNSDYDVKSTLQDVLTPEFFKIVTVHNRKYNVGGGCNIALTFLQTESPWMWLLSDDDVTIPTSLDTVLSDIDTYTDVCWLKYSINGFAKFKNQRIDKLVDLFNAFRTDGHVWGEFVFMSNNVYNLQALNNVRGNILYWVATCFSQITGPLMAIKRESQPVILRSACLTNYEGGRISYKLHYAYTNFPHLLNASFEMDHDEVIAFRGLFYIGLKELMMSLFEVENKAMRYEFYKQYKIFYFAGHPIDSLIFGIVYYLFDGLNMNHKKLLHLKKYFFKF